MRTGVAIQTSNYDWDNVQSPLVNHSRLHLLFTCKPLVILIFGRKSPCMLLPSKDLQRELRISNPSVIANHKDVIDIRGRTNKYHQ